MTQGARVFFLFDIDGTILLAGALAEESYRDAFAAVMGRPYSIRSVDCSGRTDPWIVREVLELHGHEREAQDPEIHQQIFSHFLEGMRTRLGQGMRARILAGVRESLAWLEAHPSVVLGLLTGNLEAGANLKLSAAGVETKFLTGAFGSDHHDRNYLGPIALSRFSRLHGSDCLPDQVWIVGDSIHDIACARVAGFKVLAVSSGNTPHEMLEKHAPDVLVTSLSIEVFTSIIERSTAESKISGARA
jgi:phosphoglycolate phosphatase-like HAD superfamily hydrolase